MTTPTVTACPFCHPAPERIIFENPLVIALWDAFPVNRGHALIVTRRHVVFADSIPPEQYRRPSRTPVAADDLTHLLQTRLARPAPDH